MKQQTNRPKALHIILWVAQIILGGMFIMAGMMKSTQPIVDLSKSVPWTANVSLDLEQRLYASWQRVFLYYLNGNIT